MFKHLGKNDRNTHETQQPVRCAKKSNGNNGGVAIHSVFSVACRDWPSLEVSRNRWSDTHTQSRSRQNNKRITSLVKTIVWHLGATTVALPNRPTSASGAVPALRRQQKNYGHSVCRWQHFARDCSLSAQRINSEECRRRCGSTPNPHWRIDPFGTPCSTRRNPQSATCLCTQLIC